jgi:hypothetical protein
MDSEFEVIKLEYLVKIICIPEILEKSMLLSLVRLMINNKSRFITYTKSHNEISLVLDNDTLNTFNPTELASVNIDPTDYRILQIFENSCGMNHIGIVSRLSRLFSENEIPIMYINSYNNNYILYPDIFKTTIDTLISGSIHKNEI